MTRLFFVVNALDEADFAPYAARYLPECHIETGTELPDVLTQYRLIVLWSYRKVIRSLPPQSNVILFHSSDLPRGRGWAPIYHTLAGGETHYTISGIFAAPQVDAGDVIVKARFPILSHYTAADLRRFDSEICVMLIRRMLDHFGDAPLAGVPQLGTPTYFPRRRPEENELDVSRPLSELIPHLRACEPRHPAFFRLAGTVYRVYIEAAEPPSGLPDDVAIEFGVPAGHA